jgi:hypothetical protein
MGAQQVKCSCGRHSTIEVVVIRGADFRTEKPFGFDVLSSASGYKAWEYRFDEYRSYPCDICADSIGDKLDRTAGLNYEMRKSNKGYWRHDLP